jgi:lipoate-protein ligase A
MEKLISQSPSLPVPQSAFLFLLDPPGDGAWNMAVDETLLEAAANGGQCSLRFYQWAVPTLSLGYFQAYADRQRHASSRNCAAVRRTSGGGAILHDHELTYSLAVPDGHPLAANRLGTYRVVHEAIIRTLAKWGVEARLFEKPIAHPKPPVRPEPFLCFERRAAGDVVVGGEKIAGSAQRRCRGAVLQHGSVLLAKSAAAPELNGLKELTAKPILVEEFLQAWLEQLSETLAIHWRHGELSEEQRCRAERLAVEKYASAAWTNAR